MRRRPPPTDRPRASAEVAALRRTVWRRRLLVILAVSLVVSSYYFVLDRGVAHLRGPAVVLAPDSLVYTHALEFLVKPVAQLTLQATTINSPRLGTTGPLAPQSLRTDSTGRVWLSLSSYGTVGETGGPVVYPGGEYRITSHRQDMFGLVRQVTVECRYVVCWDRKARSGTALAGGDPLPDVASAELVQGYLKRYSAPEIVADVLTMNLSGSSRLWEILLVQRLDRQGYVAPP